MIEKLTPEQEQLLPVYRDKWLAIGLSTEEIDVEASKEAIRRAYSNQGLKCPEVWYVRDSPRQAVEVELKCKDGSLYKPKLSDFVYGNHDASWLGFHNYHLEVLGLDCCEPLKPIMDLASVCGWWAPYDEAVILVHRPVELHMVDGELHNDTGPAVLYRDGFSVYSITGVRVDSQIVMNPHTQTIDQIRLEDNEEVKRIRIERYGWEAYMENVGAKLINSRYDDVSGTHEALYEINGGMRSFVGRCRSTGRVYFLEVDPKVNTCKEAQEWFLGPDLKDVNILGAS